MLVEAVRAKAAEQGVSTAELFGSKDRAAARYGRLERGVTRRGTAHRAAIKDLEKVAKAAGIALDDV